MCPHREVRTSAGSGSVLAPVAGQKTPVAAAQHQFAAVLESQLQIAVRPRRHLGDRIGAHQVRAMNAQEFRWIEALRESRKRCTHEMAPRARMHLDVVAGRTEARYLC